MVTFYELLLKMVRLYKDMNAEGHSIPSTCKRRTVILEATVTYQDKKEIECVNVVKQSVQQLEDEHTTQNVCYVSFRKFYLLYVSQYYTGNYNHDYCIQMFAE